MIAPTAQASYSQLHMKKRTTKNFGKKSLGIFFSPVWIEEGNAYNYIDSTSTTEARSTGKIVSLLLVFTKCTPSLQHQHHNATNNLNNFLIPPIYGSGKIKASLKEVRWPY